MRGIRDWSVATRLFVVQLLAVLVVAVIAVAALAADARQREVEDAAATSLAIATSIADNPFVVDALTADDPSGLLQPYAERIMDDADLDYITIMRPDRTRLTHRDRDQIGLPFQGTIAPALDGTAFTETFAGTLGPSVRAVAPISDASGEIVALVSAGITISNVTIAADRRLPIVLGVAVFLAFGIALTSLLVSRYLRRATWGRSPDQMRSMFSFYESVLHSVREGLVLVDDRRMIVLYNDQAAEMLALDRQGDGFAAVPVSQVPVPSLRDLLGSSRVAVDEIHLTEEQVLVVNQEFAMPSGRFAPRTPVGVVTTLRDHTEVQRLTGELDSTRTLSDALRAQTHEFANRLHTIVSLIELGRAPDALTLATDDLQAGQRLVDRVVGAVAEPVVAALLVGKTSQAGELGIAFHLDMAEELQTTGIAPLDLVTVIGNLVDNALDAALLAGPEPWVEVYIANDDDVTRLVVQVSDSGAGLDEPSLARAAERGFSTKEPGEFGRGLGLALVLQTVRRLHGTITATRAPTSTVSAELPLVRA